MRILGVMRVLGIVHEDAGQGETGIDRTGQPKHGADVLPLLRVHFKYPVLVSKSWFPQETSTFSATPCSLTYQVWIPLLW